MQKIHLTAKASESLQQEILEDLEREDPDIETAKAIMIVMEHNKFADEQSEDGND